MKVQTSSSSLIPLSKIDLEATLRSLRSGLSYLTRLQDPSGVWTDFWLTVGASNAWVTAYVAETLRDAGIVLNEESGNAKRAVERAANALLALPRTRRGWGYNHRVAPDADSTAHVLTFLSRVGAQVPQEAVTFLREHRHSNGHFSTYLSVDPNNEWGRTCPDLTAAALLALHDSGALSTVDLAREWSTSLEGSQTPDGTWHGYWWNTPNYTTGMVLSVWDAIGRPPLHYPLPKGLPASNAFDLGWSMMIDEFVHKECFVTLDALERLLTLQEPDGGWPAAPILRVPPSHPGVRGGSTQIAKDDRRLFATATAVRALASLVARQKESVPVDNHRRDLRPNGQAQVRSQGSIQSRHLRSALGRRLSEFVYQTAITLCFPQSLAREAETLYTDLTRRSLAQPSPWPSEQLSSLSGGVPVEFSTVLGESDRTALRYAVEVGAPYLAPKRRALTGLGVLARVAHDLGYADVWTRVHHAVRALIALQTHVPPDLRFGVWGGVDQSVPSEHESNPRPKLKVYVNLLDTPHSPGLPKLLAMLKNADIPVRAETLAALNLLNEAGFPQEIGFRLGPNGACDCKVYFELPGWSRGLAESVLERLGWSRDAAALVPEIPGIVRESLARKHRSGLSLRVDTRTGAPLDLTSAAAFPPPMKSPESTRQSVLAWAAQEGWSYRSYSLLSELLLRAWKDAEPSFGKMHTLFTRTLTYSQAYATLYLRPHIGNLPVYRIATGPEQKLISS